MESKARFPLAALIATIVWVLALFPAAMAVMFSPMMFDAPGSEKNPQMLALFHSVIWFPVFCIAAIVASWVLWRFTRTRHGAGIVLADVAVAALPAIPLGAFIYLIAFTK